MDESPENPNNYHGSSDDDDFNGGASVAQLQAEGERKMNETDAALARSRMVVAETQEIGQATLGALKEQTDQLKDIEKQVDDTQSNVEAGQKVIKKILKGIACDKLQLCLLLLVVIAVVLMVILLGVGVGNDDDEGDSVPMPIPVAPETPSPPPPPPTPQGPAPPPAAPPPGPVPEGTVVLVASAVDESGESALFTMSFQSDSSFTAVNFLVETNDGMTLSVDSVQLSAAAESAGFVDGVDGNGLVTVTTDDGDGFMPDSEEPTLFCTCNVSVPGEYLSGDEFGFGTAWGLSLVELMAGETTLTVLSDDLLDTNSSTPEQPTPPSPPAPVMGTSPPPAVVQLYDVSGDFEDGLFVSGAPIPQGLVLWTNNENSTDTSGSVRISIVHLNLVIEILVSESTPDDGQFNPAFQGIVLEGGLPTSDQYQWRVQDTADASVFGLSDAFLIAGENLPPPPSLPMPPPFLQAITNVEHPFDVLQSGEPVPGGLVTWTSGDAPAGAVAITIVLESVSNVVAIMTEDTPDDGQFNPFFQGFVVPAGLLTSSNYRIKVADVENVALFGLSDILTIEGDAIVPSAPPPHPAPPPSPVVNGPPPQQLIMGVQNPFPTLVAGEAFPEGIISWEAGATTSGDVAISIVLNSFPNEVGSIVDATPDDGKFNPAFSGVVVPEGLQTSDNYQVKVADAVDGTIFGLSEAFTIQGDLATPPM
eukprot:scaffold2828_cov352-Prasinococcus_capsulatus_cf.AAC.3